ncbi:methyltransferase [Streptomyces sp. NRRL S-350]|uniref:methyltransferase n=1 Tax=Streptomyces sp. NRRL S-350 TaxID=1463902 RepID=UPI00131D1F55|nr:methyltransferase [Streptomyces sp. NRRL S-350]
MIEAADQLGVLADLARGPLSLAEIADRAGIEPAVAQKFLAILVWNGILHQNGDRWALDEVLSADVTSGALPLLRIEGWAARDHLNATGIVAALRGHRRPPEIDDGFVGELAEAMLRGARASAPHLARLPLWRDRTHLADLAGGSGGYAILLCRMYPGLRATVYDRPEMLEHTARAVADAGLADRIALAPWDLRGDSVPAGHDCALLSHVLHLLDAPARVGLLGRVRAALAEGDPVVVHDFMPGVAAGEPSPEEAASAIDWLANGSGFLPGPDELGSEFTAAGISVRTVTPIAATRTTVVSAACTIGPPDRQPVPSGSVERKA